MNTDKIFQALISPLNYDTNVQTILQVVLPGFCQTFMCFFSYYLSEGVWKEARFDENLRQKTQSVPKQKKFSKTIFGHLDRILRGKTNSTSIANEAYVMFIHNKTLE